MFHVKRSPRDSTLDGSHGIRMDRQAYAPETVRFVIPRFVSTTAEPDPSKLPRKAARPQTGPPNIFQRFTLRDIKRSNPPLTASKHGATQNTSYRISAFRQCRQEIWPRYSDRNARKSSPGTQNRRFAAPQRVIVPPETETRRCALKRLHFLV